MNVWIETFQRRELLYNLISRNLKSRYKDSALGFLWSLLIPLFMAGIYMVFLRILARGIPMEEILIGVFAWQFTSQCVGNGLTCVTDNANLVKKVYFPRIVLPLSTTISNLINFLLTLIVQFILVAILLGLKGQPVSAAVVFMPVVILYQTLFCFALTLFLSCVNVFFRDLQHLVSVLITAWFFLTPAMYSLKLVEDMARHYAMPSLVHLYMLNPMAVIITAYRALILPGHAFPTGVCVWVSTGFSLFFLIASLMLFQKKERSFSDMF